MLQNPVVRTSLWGDSRFRQRTEEERPPDNKHAQAGPGLGVCPSEGLSPGLEKGHPVKMGGRPTEGPRRKEREEESPGAQYHGGQGQACQELQRRPLWKQEGKRTTAEAGRLSVEVGGSCYHLIRANRIKFLETFSLRNV